MPRPIEDVYQPVFVSRSHTFLPLQPSPDVLAQPERNHRRYRRNDRPAEHILHIPIVP